MLVVCRELVWGLPLAAEELRAWRRGATTIPDRTIRLDALDALTRKRPHLDGAALFSTLHGRPRKTLVRALICYEAILELLDNLNERAAYAGVRNGQQMHSALQDALRLQGPDSNYLQHHPFRDDAGQLAALVGACRQMCARLSSYTSVRPRLLEEGRRAQVLALNHEPEPDRREQLLREWARREHPDEPASTWFELSGAATASLTVHALLALASQHDASDSDVERAVAAYPRLALAATMLDSYMDQGQDTIARLHSYISHYGGPASLRVRLLEIVRDASGATHALRDGASHAVIFASMVALYLSSDQALRERRHGDRMALLRAAGPTARLLSHALRAWRLALRLTDA